MGYKSRLLLVVAVINTRWELYNEGNKLLGHHHPKIHVDLKNGN
jgi:hypothetical protein